MGDTPAEAEKSCTKCGGQMSRPKLVQKGPNGRFSEKLKRFCVVCGNTTYEPTLEGQERQREFDKRLGRSSQNTEVGREGI